MSETLRQGR